MSATDDDSQTNFVLGFVLALIALVIFFVLGIAIHFGQGKARLAAGAPAAVASGALAAPVPEGASIRVLADRVVFYFASGSAELAPGADVALAEIVKAVAAGRKALISGYHDSTGNLATNEELAKQRAQAVQLQLLQLGLTPEQAQLEKPALSSDAGSNAAARRVEVTLAP